MHPARIPSQDEVLQFFRRAGFPALTSFQQKLVPVLLSRRDAVAEAPHGAGTSSAIAAPLVLALRGAGPALRALILLPTPDDVARMARAFQRFTRAMRDPPSFVALGEPEDARRAQRRLEREGTVVAGTTDRVIDHIRRGGLSFGELETVIMREPESEGRADFVKDVQFISAKWTDRPRVVLLTRGALAADDELAEMLHHPVTLDQEREPAAVTQAGAPAVVSPAGRGEPARVVLVVEGASRVELLARAILGMRLPPVLALHAPRTDARAAAEQLRSRGLRAAVLPPGGGRQQVDRRDLLDRLSRRAMDVLLVPFTAALAPDLEALGSAQVALLDVPTGAIRSPGGMLKRAGIVALAERDRDLGRLQEAIGVSFERTNPPDDEAFLTGAIDRFLHRAREEDRTELVRLRNQIRRQVPLGTRPLFMAALLKALLPAGPAPAPSRERPAGSARGPERGPDRPDRADRGPERVPAGGGRPAGGARGRVGAPQPAPAVDIPPKGQRGRFGRAIQEASVDRPAPVGDSAQLFVSVGRNRRVFARDLMDLFTEKLQLAPGDIRDVRVFDKYSFVDIAPSRAEEAITKLSGLEVKGRPIAVNYAKKKEEKGAK
ncbi:MAG TPA: DEAD/DEAH box helicase [Spirochaetia bacterium]|nr:DEAD/DEAH box helicase [Spirochaetia bacterium]